MYDPINQMMVETPSAEPTDAGPATPPEPQPDPAAPAAEVPEPSTPDTEPDAAPAAEETPLEAQAEPGSEPEPELSAESDADPDEAVRTAEKEAVDAEARIEHLESRFVDGDDEVGQEQIEQQRGIAAFAKLRVQRARVKAERIKAAKRTVAAEQIASEVGAYSGGLGKKLAAQLRTMQKADEKYWQMLEDHDRQIRDWRTRADALGIPEHDGRPLPPAVDGRIAIGRGTLATGSNVILRVGRRDLYYVGGGAGQSEGNAKARAEGWAQRIAAAEKIEPEQPEPDANLLFFRNRNTGAFFYTSPDVPLLATFQANPDLEPVSREEALGS